MKKLLTILSLAILANISSYAQGEIKLSGSDIIAPVIKESLEKLANREGLKVNFQMNGTYSAMKEFSDGKCDIAVIALPKGRKLPDNLMAIPLAYQVAYVIVNSINPLEEISVKILKGIFSADANPRIETWEQINVKNIGMRNIMPAVSNNVNNVSLELFKYEAMDGTNIASWVENLPTYQDLINTIKSNNSSIAVISKAPNSKGMKILAISKPSKDGTEYAFRPDINSIFNGDYPMSMPFYIVFDKKNISKIKPLAKLLLENSIAEAIDKSDFLSAPENSRKKSVFELDITK